MCSLVDTARAAGWRLLYKSIPIQIDRYLWLCGIAIFDMMNGTLHIIERSIIGTPMKAYSYSVSSLNRFARQRASWAGFRELYTLEYYGAMMATMRSLFVAACVVTIAVLHGSDRS